MVDIVSINNITRPGVFVTETASGIQPPAIAPFRTCYLNGSGTKGDFDTPTQITSLADAVNVFGISVDGVVARSIRLYFANNPNGVLFFNRVPVGDRYQAELKTPGQSGDLLTLSVTDPDNPTTPAKTFEYTIDAATNLTEADQIAAFADAITQDATISNEVSIEGETDSDAKFIVRANDPTVNRTILLTATPAGSPTALSSTDIGDTYLLNFSAIGDAGDTVTFDLDGSSYVYTVAAGDVGDYSTFFTNLETEFDTDATVGAIAQLQNADPTARTIELRVTNPASSPTLTVTPTGTAVVNETQYGESIEYQIPADFREDDVLTLTVAGSPDVSIQYVVTATDAAAIGTLLSNFASAINSDANLSSLVVAENTDSGNRSLEVRLLDTQDSRSDLSATLSRSILLEYAKITDSFPARYDWLWTFDRAYDPDEFEQGFLIAPEAFYYLPQTDRVAVGTKMHDLAATYNFNWMAIVDCGRELKTTEEFKDEGTSYSPVRGHLAYYAPYLLDLDGNDIPPSAAVVGLALRRYREQNFIEPPAGTQYPIFGAADVAVRIKNAQQSVLNPEGINVVRNLRHVPNGGIVVWGARTRSKGLFRWVNGRIVVNILIKTLENAFYSQVFSAADGFGILRTRLKEQANAILYRFWLSGALYGDTTADAYAVVCDDSNNPAIDLENGIVRIDVFVKVAPTIEAILISVKRTSIGAYEFEYEGSDANVPSEIA